MAPFIRFSSRGYTRNLVHGGTWYNLLVLCWKNGQRSPVHDHAASACAVRVLRGTLTDTRFTFAPNGAVKALGGRLDAFYFALGEDDVVAIVEAESNISAATFAMGVAATGTVRTKTTVLLTPEEIGYSLADAGAKVVVTELASLSALLAVRDRLADLQSILVIGGPPAPRGTFARITAS